MKRIHIIILISILIAIIATVTFISVDGNKEENKKGGTNISQNFKSNKKLSDYVKEKKNFIDEVYESIKNNYISDYEQGKKVIEEWYKPLGFDNYKILDSQTNEYNISGVINEENKDSDIERVLTMGYSEKIRIFTYLVDFYNYENIKFEELDTLIKAFTDIEYDEEEFEKTLNKLKLSENNADYVEFSDGVFTKGDNIFFENITLENGETKSMMCNNTIGLAKFENNGKMCIRVKIIFSRSII